MEHKPIIAITMGDPSGIGPEICLKLLDNEDVHNICNVIIFGDVAVLNLAATKLNLNRPNGVISHTDWLDLEKTPEEINVIDIGKINTDNMAIGEVSKASGQASFDYIEKAIMAAISNKVDAITTCPINKKSLNGNIGIIKKGQVKYGFAIDDNAYLNYNDYKMKAIATISNIARQLVCIGICPQVCCGFLKISKDNKREKNSFLKGIHDAGKFLNLNIKHLSFEISEDITYGKFMAAGIYTRNELIPNTFITEDLFISILGSHRGELGGSRYLHLLNQENKGYRPVVDLLMESRLQEAVLTGINEDLIQSARPVGRGGVALSIAKSFEKNSNLGARIYFSRKLIVLIFKKTMYFFPPQTSHCYLPLPKMCLHYVQEVAGVPYMKSPHCYETQCDSDSQSEP